MTAELMSDWIEVVWQWRPGAMLGGPLGTRSLLDAFSGHLAPEVKRRLQKSNCDLVIIPGGMTPVLQPLDVSVNKPFNSFRTAREISIMSDRNRSAFSNADLKVAPGDLKRLAPSAV